MSGIATALEQFVQILISGVVTLAQGIASGVVAMSKALFLDITVADGVETVNGLSIFGGIIAIFAGIGLAVSLTTRVYKWVTSLGH